MVAVLAFGAFLGALWGEHNRDVTLPQPSGQFPVGRTIADWRDTAHIDPMAPPGTPRELLVWIWYPAQHSGALDEYDPSTHAHALPFKGPAILRPVNWVFKLLTTDYTKVHAHSLHDAPVSPQQAAYPVVLLRGGASVQVRNYTTLAEDLASHGYVVVGIDAPYRTGRVVFPDGRSLERRPENDPDMFEGEALFQLGATLVDNWAADMTFAVDRLEQLNASDERFHGKLDLQKIGAFGHSLGGAEALEFCHNDARCKTAINVDGAPWGKVVTEGLAQPVFFLLSDHSSDPADDEARTVAVNLGSLFAHSPNRSQLMIKGANHFMFSDDAVLKSRIVMGALKPFGILKVDGRRQLAIATHYISGYFDAVLAGRTASLPEISADYPEVQAFSLK
jgi:dienelactone hydrolase